MPTSRLSRLARNQEDCANKKSPASTATLVPNRVFTVIFPARSRPASFRIRVSKEETFQQWIPQSMKGNHSNMLRGLNKR